MDEKLLASMGLLSAVGLSQISPELILSLLANLNFIQLLILAVQGSTMIGKVRLAGWREKIPIFLEDFD